MSEQQTKNIYTVSELTSEIKSFLENRYPFVWISGEISNLARPSSGHLYFTLKDNRAQISSVMFRAQTRSLKFELKNGLEISGFGRVSLYEPRGAYQFIFEFIEPKGTGALQLAFEQLKKKLHSEGLFETVHKQKLPFLPKRIGVVTSPSGAVIHDIINVINRRFPSVAIEIAPVSVQGSEAESEIVSAIEMLNKRALSDLIIIARGGGSLEDLAAFNSEAVARAVFASETPVVSAVGHETDYTICDFVSDLRAPTPSAAAEIIVPDKAELEMKVNGLSMQLYSAIRFVIERHRNSISAITKRIRDPRRRIHDLQFLTEDLRERLTRAIQNNLKNAKQHLKLQTEKLRLNSPVSSLPPLRNSIEKCETALFTAISRQTEERRMRLKELTGRLNSLNPSAVIDRGYSITRTIPGGNVITDSNTVEMNQDVEVILAKGKIVCSVKGVT